jgi:hypothetical protein
MIRIRFHLWRIIPSRFAWQVRGPDHVTTEPFPHACPKALRNLPLPLQRNLTIALLGRRVPVTR